jgi:hypothetical protein
MKEILDTTVWIGLGYILFIFLRGMNETQTNKHNEALKKRDKEND